MINKRFKLKQSDGEMCAQVLIYNEDDLKYWTEQAKKTGHLIAFDYHVPENAMGYNDPAHDIYQIFPPEQAHKIHLSLPNKKMQPTM